MILSSNHQVFLKSLPKEIKQSNIIFTHVSPRKIKRKIDNAIEAWNVFDEHTFQLLFVGHTHVPYIFGESSTDFGMSHQHNFIYNQPFQLTEMDRYIIAVGSVGYGRDNIGKVRYTIFDNLLKTIEHRAIQGELLSLDYSHMN